MYKELLKSNAVSKNNNTLMLRFYTVTQTSANLY